MGTNDGNIYISSDLKDFKSSIDHHPAKKVPSLSLSSSSSSSSSSLKVTDRAKLGKTVGGVTAITGDNEKSLLVTGAKDGSITIWDTSSLSSTVDDPTFIRHFILSDGKSNDDVSADTEKVVITDITAKGIQSISIAPRILVLEKGQPVQVLLLLLLLLSPSLTSSSSSSLRSKMMVSCY